MNVMQTVAWGDVFNTGHEYSISEYSQRIQALAKESHPLLTGVVGCYPADTRIKLS